MRKWNRIFSLGGLCMVIGVVTAQHAQPTRADAQIERGKYLVMHVAMCVQCHTPRDEHGALDWSHMLQGAPMPVKSPFPGQPWAFRAPTLAGLPGWETEDAITLLVTGAQPDGHSPHPPMPPFRMVREDAAAVVAYLQSLPPPG